MWRLAEYEDTCLYDWIRLHDKTKMARKRKSKKPEFAEPVDDVECDSEFEDCYDWLSSKIREAYEDEQGR